MRNQQQKDKIINLIKDDKIFKSLFLITNAANRALAASKAYLQPIAMQAKTIMLNIDKQKITKIIKFNPQDRQYPEVIFSDFNFEKKEPLQLLEMAIDAISTFIKQYKSVPPSIEDFKDDMPSLMKERHIKVLKSIKNIDKENAFQTFRNNIEDLEKCQAESLYIAGGEAYADKQYQLAIPYFQSALELYQKYYPANSLSIATVFYGLGSSYMFANQFDLAIPNLTEAAAIRKKYLEQQQGKIKGAELTKVEEQLKNAQQRLAFCKNHSEKKSTLFVTEAKAQNSESDKAAMPDINRLNLQ